MGWEGSTGHLYLTGANGCTRYHEIEGRKVRAIYGNYTASLALTDGWKLEWMTPQPMELRNSLYDIKIYQLAFGRNHTIALSLDGHLFAWGDGQYGQLGLGGNVNQAKNPQKIREIPQAHFTSIASGGYHSAAITDSGSLYMWGRNFEGQLGHAMHCMTREQNEAKYGVVHHPKHVDDFLKKLCKQIACGDKFSIILTENGEVYACGEGQMGQLGQGRCTKLMHPMLTLLAEKHDLFVQVACGWAHALALTGSGRLFAWGFNHYGQLGVDDTKTRFFPEEIPGLLFKQVYASGNYSAAISSAGRLYTWGNGSSGKLGHQNHENIYRPKVVQAVQDTYIRSIACASDHMLFFAPSWVEQIIPTSGSFHGGTELKIFGSGFWNTPDLTVRFVPLTEGRLARATLAKFDPTTGIISCEVPRFSVPGDFAVEVAINGKHFTTNGVTFEVFVPPVFTFLSHQELPLVSSTQVHIHLRGTKPKATQSLLVRWAPLDQKYEPIVVGGEYGEIMKEITSGDEDENINVIEEDVENDDDMFMISFSAPSFNMNESELIACHVEVSFNGLNYLLVRLIESGSSDAEIVYFHEAAITRIVPNSISLVDNSMDIQIRLQQMFDIGQFKCRIRFSEEETFDLPYRTALANLQINSYSIEEQTVYCTIPPFSDWRVDTITPKSVDSDDDNSKRRPSVPQATPGPWYQPENRKFTMTVLVSINGGATYLPPISPGADNIYAYTPGLLESIQPASGPLGGGTLATITSNYVYFDTNDAMVSIDFNGDIQFVPGFVKASEESTERRLFFEVPPFFVQPPVPTESPRPGGGPNYPAPPNLPLAVIKVALNGSTYHEESSLSFEFYFNPKIMSIEPSVVSPGAIIQMTGELFRTSPLVKYRLAKADNSLLFDVQANYLEDKTSKVIKLEIPPLGNSADGELWFSIALNGQRYFTSENARIVYIDQPEPVATKDDKKKH
ncbi:hypothetical protein THRCLA_10453 [Thraustotheca clavata]|uniref:Regulator of chromosome condensation (RCC1) n=1 Tax=Thraustotheca clavata TaxID=74557 RepID=A0A1V9YP54_9STRA|nr:hypothetical protein THRCLA_10453 [Thraustotheca clavata]